MIKISNSLYKAERETKFIPQVTVKKHINTAYELHWVKNTLRCPDMVLMQ